MEVTPEIYAWLASLNIIDPFKSLSEDYNNNFIIPEKTLKLLFGGKYMDIILQKLQESYNQFYKVKIDYISKISQLKPIEENQEYISNSIKYANWEIIAEILGHFGLSYSEEEINLLVNNNREQLYKIISKIYELFTQFLKHSINNKDTNNTVIIDNNGNQGTKTYMVSTSNKKYGKTKDLKNETIELNYQNSQKNIITNNRYNKYKNNNKNINQENLKIKEQAININDLDPSKSYRDCNSTLEFFILSLCKNLKMKPRQSVALLSNNRKYLSIICNKGFNNKYNSIKNWLTDLYNNIDIMTKLIQESEDGTNISYGTIGTAICCKDPDICLQAAQLLNILNYRIGMNWDWFLNEGIESFIFTLTKHQKNKLELVNILYEFIKDDTSIFFDELRKKLNNEKNIVLEFISNIICLAKDLNSNFGIDIQNLIYDICLKEKNDYSLSLSILSDTFYYFYPIEEDIINKILAYFKECIRNNVQNIFSTAIFQIFNLMERFGKIKNKYAPQLYKILVFLFLEEYDDELKREIILEGFEKFFNNNHEIPIDILLEPYLNQLNSSQNYALCDFLFFLKMVEHPRIESKDLSDIIQFILNVCLNNIMYSRTANLVLSLIFEKNLIDKKCIESYEINEIEDKLIDFITTSLDLFINNLTKNEDKYILETTYDIITENFSNINNQVKDIIIKSVKEYRKIKGVHSNGLLAILWNYDDHDDVMMQIEEMYRPVYEPLDQYYEKKKKEQDEKDKKDFTKKLKNNLSKIQEKRMNIILSRKIINEEKKIKEDRIKKRLAERRRIASVMSGLEPPPKVPILFYNTKLKKSGSTLYILKKNLSFNPNDLETGKLNSNMQYAMNNATQNYLNKGIIQSNTKMSQLSSNNFRTQKVNISSISNSSIKLRRNRSQIDINNIYENKKRDDVVEKYGNIISIDRKKQYNEAEKEYKLNQKIEMSKLLIQKEGKFVKISNNSQSLIRYILAKNIINKTTGLPFNLEEEEDRELKAINGYNKEYRKNLKFYFKSYGNEIKQTITKSKFIKMMRDKGINKERMDLEEINTLIRLLFKENLNEFNFNQFINLLVQLSYLIYTKRRPALTIGETYGILLRRFTLNNNAVKIAFLKKKYEDVIGLLLELKQEKEPFNLPEGFKFVNKTTVKYNNRLAPHFIDILGEGKYVCYQIIEDILFNIFNSSIIEPYVEVYTEETVEIEPEKLRNWTPGLTMAYIELDKKYRFHGMFAADAIEDGLRKILKKSMKDENIYDSKNTLKKENKSNFKISWAREGILKKMEQYKKIKMEEKKKKMIKKYIDIFKVSKEEKIKIKKKFDEVRIRRQKKSEEKHNKLIMEQEKKKEKEEQKLKERIIFYKKQHRKLAEQFRTIKNKREQSAKKFEERKEDEIKLKKENKSYTLSNKDKEYYTFEKNLNNTIKELINKEDIKVIFEKYNNHIKLIYDIYSRIGYNKISFYSKEAISIDEFKQFCINFTILGVSINTEQMLWIFKNISKVKQNKRYGQMYFDFDDFKLSICYLAIFSKFGNKDKKILPKDIEDTNGENIENFMKFMEFKLPFNKIEMENFINERRSITMKNLLDLQNKTKKKELNELKNNINDKNKENPKDKNIKDDEKSENNKERISNNKKSEGINTENIGNNNINNSEKEIENNDDNKSNNINKSNDKENENEINSNN